MIHTIWDPEEVCTERSWRGHYQNGTNLYLYVITEDEDGELLLDTIMYHPANARLSHDECFYCFFSSSFGLSANSSWLRIFWWNNFFPQEMPIHWNWKLSWERHSFDNIVLGKVSQAGGKRGREERQSDRQRAIHFRKANNMVIRGTHLVRGRPRFNSLFYLIQMSAWAAGYRMFLGGSLLLELFHFL